MNSISAVLKKEKRAVGEKRAVAARLLSLFLLLLVSALPAAGAELSAYREKIGRVKESIDILFYADWEEAGEEVLNFERETLKKIRAELPARETIEAGGETIEVDNGWFLKKLSEFDSERSDAERREKILLEISTRLAGLEIKLRELERAQAAARSKDEEKQKLDEILRRPEYQTPEPKTESLFQSILRRVSNWFARFFPKPNIDAPSVEGIGALTPIIQFLVLAIVLGIIGFLIYRFAPFLRRRFKGRDASEREERVVLGETLAADASAENLFAEAERLAREGNLRGAIRKGYVALLCELADRKIIGLNKHKTNRDYLRDVRRREALHRNMKVLTNDFERVWYGAGESADADWQAFREKYKQTLSEAK